MTVDDILRTDNRDDNEGADEREKRDEIEKERISRVKGLHKNELA